MKENTISVEINGRTEQYEKGVTYREIAAAHQEEEKYPIVLVRADGRLRELNKRAADGSRLEFLALDTKAGHSTYTRSLIMLMLRAMYHIVGDNSNIDRVGVHFVVSDGLYCTMKGKTPLTQEFLDRVKAYMEELTEKALPIRKTTEHTYEVCRKFEKYRMYDKAELFRYRRASKVNLYYLENFEDYFYGYMLPDTSYLKYFDLQLFEDGFVLRFPTREEPQKLPPFCPEMKIFHVQKDSMEWGAKLGIPTVGALNTYIVEHRVKGNNI